MEKYVSEIGVSKRTGRLAVRISCGGKTVFFSETDPENKTLSRMLYLHAEKPQIKYDVCSDENLCFGHGQMYDGLFTRYAVPALSFTQEEGWKKTSDKSDSCIDRFLADNFDRIPEKLCTEDLSVYAVKQDYTNLRLVDFGNPSYGKICMAALTAPAGGYALRYIPEDRQTGAMCEAAIRSAPGKNTWDYVADCYRTPQLFHTAAVAMFTRLGVSARRNPVEYSAAASAFISDFIYTGSNSETTVRNLKKFLSLQGAQGRKDAELVIMSWDDRRPVRHHDLSFRKTAVQSRPKQMSLCMDGR